MLANYLIATFQELNLISLINKCGVLRVVAVQKLMLLKKWFFKIIMNAWEITWEIAVAFLSVQYINLTYYVVNDVRFTEKDAMINEIGLMVVPN